MRDGRYHEERMIGGHRFVIDLADLDGTYEVMVLTWPKGTEYECKRTESFCEALAYYERMLEEYVEKKPALTGKYAKLRDDLALALAAGRDAEALNPEDGGSCNFDSPAICLPRWKSSLVKQAAEEAGSGCFEWKLFGTKLWVFRPDTHAQGNARSRNAEAVVRALKEMGYDAMEYCQAD